MSNLPPPSWTAYDQESQKYIESYSKLYFANIHRQFIRFLPIENGARILDVGCGSGRDALSLARRGYNVTAVDPSVEMLNYARSRNNHPQIDWINDSLPTLAKLKYEKYRFILMSAVWMHIPPSQRSSSLERLSSLIKSEGRIAITLRIAPPDPLRIMYQVSKIELLSLAKKYSLSPIYISRPNKDSLKRNTVKWEKVVLQKSGSPI